MGFTGDFILARCDKPLLELPVFGSEPACDYGHTGCLSMCWPRPGGWQTLQVLHGLPDNEDDRWLQMLVTATDAPVAIASVFDSDVCMVRGLSASGTAWSAVLNPVVAAEYEIPASVPVDDLPLPHESKMDQAIRSYLAASPAIAAQLSKWADEAGFTADRDALLSVLAKRADPFAEDLFFELIDACGLPTSIEPGEVVHDVPAHRGHRPDERCPRGGELERAVLNLPRGGHLVLECATNTDCYAQVWLRPDGTYQLEYRDCSPAEHHQTRTVSAEKVIEALSGWTAGEVQWRDAFQWTSIGSQFREPSSPTESES